MSSSSRKVVVGESLPPLVKGNIIGQFSIKVKQLKMRDQTFTPLNYTCQFEWWGQRGTPTVLSIPRKPGLGNDHDEVFFPLRAQMNSIQEYMSDMGELAIDILDVQGRIVGRTTLPLDKVAERGLTFSESIIVRSVRPSPSSKKVLGDLYLTATSAFGTNNLLPEVRQAEDRDTNGDDEERSAAPLPPPPPLTLGDKSPSRNNTKTSKSNSQKNVVGLSSFQRNEVISLFHLYSKNIVFTPIYVILI